MHISCTYYLRWHIEFRIVLLPTPMPRNTRCSKTYSEMPWQKCDNPRIQVLNLPTQSQSLGTPGWKTTSSENQSYSFIFKNWPMKFVYLFLDQSEASSAKTPILHLLHHTLDATDKDWVRQFMHQWPLVQWPQLWRKGWSVLGYLVFLRTCMKRRIAMARQCCFWAFPGPFCFFSV